MLADKTRPECVIPPRDNIHQQPNQSSTLLASRSFKPSPFSANRTWQNGAPSLPAHLSKEGDVNPKTRSTPLCSQNIHSLLGNAQTRHRLPRPTSTQSNKKGLNKKKETVPVYRTDNTQKSPLVKHIHLYVFFSLVNIHESP
jgi:hypothetical protein